MQKSQIAGEKLSNPWRWSLPVGRDFSNLSKVTNKLYWEWEIKYNNLKVL